jgi:hypothetical protein
MYDTTYDTFIGASLRILRRINSSEPPSPRSDTCPPGPPSVRVQFYLFPAHKKGKPKEFITPFTRKQCRTARTTEPDARRKGLAKTTLAARQLRLEAPPPLLVAPVRRPCSIASHRWKHRRPPMASPPPAPVAPPPPLAAADLCSSDVRCLQLRWPASPAAAIGLCSSSGRSL